MNRQRLIKEIHQAIFFNDDVERVHQLLLQLLESGADVELRNKRNGVDGFTYNMLPCACAGGSAHGRARCVSGSY